ncbi:MAG: hypothetical protein SCK29_12960 [Bacillota bacterium]|nr:hypothetical protein [Bacillota bacterium]MDW7685010.1 hypothetical protein [Bacillota bacterium]
MNNSFGGAEGKKSTEPSVNEDGTTQVRELMQDLYRRIQSFWQTAQQADRQLEQALQAAAGKRDNALQEIQNMRKKNNMYGLSVQGFDELKNKLSSEVGEITDPRREADDYIKAAETESRRSTSCLSFIGVTILSVIMVVFVFSKTPIGVSISRAFISQDNPLVTAFILGFWPVVVTEIIIFKFTKPMHTGLRQSKCRRLAALADLTLDRWTENAVREYEDGCAEAKSVYEKKTAELKPYFYPLLTEVNGRIRQYKTSLSCREAAWDHPCWQEWSTAAQAASEVRLGTVSVATTRPAGQEQAGG